MASFHTRPKHWEDKTAHEDEVCREWASRRVVALMGAANGMRSKGLANLKKRTNQERKFCERVAAGRPPLARRANTQEASA